MYEDKTLVCKECGAEFVFTAGENSTLKKVSRTNHRDAKLAEMLAKLTKKLREKCSQLFALAVAKKQKFLSDQEKIAQFTAANALLK
jgi:hypothetical protein